MPPSFALAPVVFFDAVGTLLHPEPSAPMVYASVGRQFGSRLEESVINDRFRAAFRRQEEADYAGGLRTDEEREVARWRAIVGEVLDDVSDGEACFQALYAHSHGPTPGAASRALPTCSPPWRRAVMCWASPRTSTADWAG